MPSGASEVLTLAVERAHSLDLLSVRIDDGAVRHNRQQQRGEVRVRSGAVLEEEVPAERHGGHHQPQRHLHRQRGPDVTPHDVEMDRDAVFARLVDPRNEALFAVFPAQLQRWPVVLAAGPEQNIETRASTL